MGMLAHAGRAATDVADVVKSSPKEALQKPKGLAGAGAALMALPYALKGLSKLTGSGGDDGKATPGGGLLSKVTESGALSKVTESGALSKLTGSDDDDGDGRAAPGHGRGRRMPIQQSVDVAVPLKVAYDRWTQFEDWPQFMHRIEDVEQVDDETVAFTTKVWGFTRRFEAQIVEQHPDERIEWNVKEGVSHTGVATFHKLANRLTRIEVSIDVEPEGLVEKAGRGMRFTKRAVRGDLHRFKAFVEMNEDAEGGWRGTIEDGDVKRRTDRGTRSSGGRSRGSTSRSSNGSAPRKSSKSRASK